MGKRTAGDRRVKYKKARRKLLWEMGHRCFRCGYKWRLEFHHLKSRTWVAAKTSRWVRLARYRREWKSGIVVLACRKCNKLIGRPKDAVTEWVDEIECSEVPF